MSIKENLNFINLKVIDSTKKSNRPEGTVKLMAVSKFHSVEEIREALNAGQMLYGENRVQEACEKFPSLKEEYPELKLHMIGSLQSNKVKQIVPLADCIQSVDRISLLEEIEKQCSKINKSIEILFEVHTGEESKAGFTSKEELVEAVKKCAEGLYPHIVPKGFMTMAPFTDDKELIKKSFSSLKILSEELKSMFPELSLEELSMGMSGDFELAIEEGSTLVRVGTAIFGERNYNK